MNDLFYLTDEQRMIRDLARKVARDRVAPHAARYDEAEAYPEDSMRAVSEAGLYARLGAGGLRRHRHGCLALALVCEEVAYACAASGTQYLDQAARRAADPHGRHRSPEEEVPAGAGQRRDPEPPSRCRSPGPAPTRPG